MKRLFLSIALCIFSTGAMPAYSAPGDILYVKPVEANVYADPDVSSSVRVVAPRGRKLVEFDRKSDWVWVGVDGTGGNDGWIQSKDVKATP